MPKFEVRDLQWFAFAMQRLVLLVEPSGGQSVARRNARSSMRQDDRRRAQRLEAMAGAAVVGPPARAAV